MTSLLHKSALAAMGCGLALSLGPVAAAQDGPATFETQVLTIDANEGCDVADFDNDGKLDVVAGRNWYRNGDWLPRPVRNIDDWNGYVESNAEFAHDVDGDGNMDVIASSFLPTEVYWYRNPGGEELLRGYQWEKRLLKDTGITKNEGAMMHDINGDGTAEWIANSWDPTTPMVVWSFTTEEREVEAQKDGQTVKEMQQVPSLQKHVLAETGNDHGLGFGDVNNDGREDIVTAKGWFERPEGDPFGQQWTFHQDWDIHASLPMVVHDFTGDGKNDIVWGNGHDYGLYLWESQGIQDGKLTFEEQVIDKEWSQPHVVLLRDIDNDGIGEIVTGKRIRGHNGNDPGANEPPVMYYYDCDERRGNFTRRVINEGTSGCGLQVRTADLDGDGDLDVISAGKEGTQINWNQLK